jgi:hypothetical protein
MKLTKRSSCTTAWLSFIATGEVAVNLLTMYEYIPDATWLNVIVSGP